MESFLICVNPKCHMVIDLRESGNALPRSQLILNECPECGSGWSTHCPFCNNELSVYWRAGIIRCLSCNRQMKPKTKTIDRGNVEGKSR